MIDFQIKLAEIPVGITAEYVNTMRRCQGYFSNDPEEAFHVHADEDDLKLEEKIFTERNYAHGETDYKVSGFHMEGNAVYRQIAEKMIDYERMVIHGSAVAVDGSVYLFIAPSGTGKSTHTRLWREVFGDRAIMINDDKPLVRMDTDEILVYGTPWDGKHHLSTNIGAPLKGVYRIYRGTENRTVRMNPEEAMVLLVTQTYRSREPARVLRTMQMLQKITERVPVFSLYCTMDREAAITAYDAVNKEEL